MKRRDAPLQPPEIIYFCKFRPKRARNYGYLVCKIQNFLRQGCTAPLQPHTYTFWQKRDWNCAFMHGFSKYTFSYEKKSRPLQPPAIIHFCKFRPQRAWKYAYLACQIQNFLTQGGAPLQPPPAGPAPWTPVNTSRKRSVCSLRSQLFEPPINLTKPMLTILCLYKFALKMLFLSWKTQELSEASPLDPHWGPSSGSWTPRRKARARCPLRIFVLNQLGT